MRALTADRPDSDSLEDILLLTRARASDSHTVQGNMVQRPSLMTKPAFGKQAVL